MTGKIKVFAFIAVLIMLLSGVTVFSFVTTNAAARPIRVACVGDSITQGSGYTTKLKLLLGANYTVANFGVAGSTVSLNSTKPYMNESRFQDAINYKPDIVVIMLGTNDANFEISPDEDEFATDYSQLINSFEQLDGKQLIWVVESPPIFASDSSYNNTYLANAVLPQIDSVTQQMSVPTVNLYDAFSNHPDYFMDGVHPDSDGASLIASNVYDAITLPDGSPDNSCFSDGYTG